jgi:hypothetical protein
MNIRQWPKTARQRSRREAKNCGKDEVCDYQLIGELRDDSHKLLLMGADGQYYAYDLVSGDISVLDPNDSWAVDLSPAASGHTSGLQQRLAS